ncbi:high mobility group B protein 15-like isoform X1 [Cucurbita moschata]|uniref:High mobility group B protein 15-like isoform X1 n=2 Tax=Cucurbita moschata TaxID=3662 RepID=A0A6J1HKA1_CUCMO|nr:high mobility group B protein 15-like isoform X1 [Cucurbita moschata]
MAVAALLLSHFLFWVFECLPYYLELFHLFRVHRLMVEEERTEAGWDSKKELTMTSTSSAGGKQLAVVEAPSNCVPYPPPQTTYEDLIADPKLFMASLEKLHSIMGTKFMIPIIGGKELDLHRLFVEVTARGGLEKVIRERRWKEVTSVFKFPSTATNASFVLRKYYLSLIHHFEQIYFFKAVGWTPKVSDSSPTPSAVPIPTQGTMTSMLPPSNRPAPQQQPQTTATELPAVAPSSVPPAGGFPVVGVIDGKFESGYLVTVTVGNEKLKGVLYMTPPEQPAQQVFQPGSVFTKDGTTSTTPSAQRRRRRKKSEIKRRDPAHPKPNRSGYNFFFAEQHARLKPLHPGKDREISRMIGELWNKLNETEKTVYQEKAMKDKERYRIEMENYREKLRTGQIISHAVPLQQLLPGTDLNMVYAADKNEETEGGELPHMPYNDTIYVEDKEEEEEEEEDDDDEEEGAAAPQGVGNVDVNVLAEEERCETRPEPTATAIIQESSTVKDDKEVFAGHAVVMVDVANEEPEPTPTAIVEDKEVFAGDSMVMVVAANEEPQPTATTIIEDKEVFAGDSMVMVEAANEEPQPTATTIIEDKEVFAGDSMVMVEAENEEPEPTTAAIIEDKEVFAGDSVVMMEVANEEPEATTAAIVEDKEVFAGDSVVMMEATNEGTEATRTDIIEDKEVFVGDSLIMMEAAKEEAEPTATAIIED